MWLSTTRLAKMEGVTTETIRRWARDGKYEEYKMTEGGHFRVKVKDERIICYVRISSHKQKTSIATQKQILLKKYPKAEVIIDIASAFNFQRKGLKTILERAMSGDAIRVVVTSQDRLARSGFELIRWIIELSGGRIESLEESVETKNFDTKELIGFITSFCNSYYGKRSAQRRSQSKSSQKD